MDLKSFVKRLKRKLLHLRLQPVRVFLFHQVGDTYDSCLCNPCDWTQTEQFKNNIVWLKKHYSFISLSQAKEHITHDWLRLKHYAVLTSDDGGAALKIILPWLKEQGVPVTLFVNGKYLDGVSYRERPSECYLTEKELFELDYDGIEIGHHGWEHNDLTHLEWSRFIDSVEKNTFLLKRLPRYVPFWAYTWGRHTKDLDSYLLSQGIMPVLIDEMKNYDERDIIHRELLDGKALG